MGRKKTSGFNVPSEKERREAILYDEKSKDDNNKWFDWNKSGLFEMKAIPKPKRGDWLDCFANDENKQSFFDYSTHFKRSTKKLNQTGSVYLVSFGSIGEIELNSSTVDILDILLQFLQSYLQIKSILLPSLNVSYQNSISAILSNDSVSSKVRARKNFSSSTLQLRTGDLMDVLLDIIPSDAICLLGVTMEDLYPSDKWNFVFGEASTTDRVGIFSFSRHHPFFPGHSSIPRPLTPQENRLFLLRSMKTAVHEIIHMFGVSHCLYYHCCMNGANHQEEAYSAPIHLCPIDLQKLQLATKFQISSRYQSLVKFYQEIGFDEEARWIKALLIRISNSD